MRGHIEIIIHGFKLVKELMLDLLCPRSWRSLSCVLNIENISMSKIVQNST